MNKLRFLPFVWVLLFSVIVLPACGTRNRDTVPMERVAAESNVVSSQVVQITGVVRLVGNEPFSELVITGAGAEWFIHREDKDKLHHMQHQTVTVEGEEIVRELTFASGRPAGLRRELRNIRIISD